MTPRATPGSPPSTRTTRFTDHDSSQTTGATTVASRSRIGAANSDTRSERCSASRLGASSPKTRVKNEIASVTTATEIAEARPSDRWCASWDFRAAARVAAPNARPNLAVAQRDQRHLGGGEEAADENDGQDNENVPADGVHVGIPDLG